MSRIKTILAQAGERAEKMGLPYAGALLPREAYQVWQEIPGSVLVDCRTRAEWDWVGRIPGAVEIEWMIYPEMTLNPHFLTELKARVDPERVVMFICRSGARSHHAAVAATAAGYSSCYNVLEGFQGDKDASGYRDTVGGWRFHGLPWAAP